MIPPEEVKQISIDQGVPITYVEKDYVMGWLLWGIYNHRALANGLYFKGGNCLRKIYFSDTRFSDDLDFSIDRMESKDLFHSYLDEICKSVQQKSDIIFDLSKTRVEEVPILEKGKMALDGRVYFKGFAGDSSITMRIKFDVSEYEIIVLPLQKHQIIHNYSDSHLCQVEILSYSLEEILAEKLRSWIQRTRARDLFDVVKIIQSKKIPVSKSSLLSTFFKKTIFKQVAFSGREEMLFDAKFKSVESNWSETIICPKAALILVASAVNLFKDFINALFEPTVLSALGVSLTAPIREWYNVNSGWREVIIQAGKERHLIRMRYDNKERDIEPYSFRYKHTSMGYREYFFGYDRTYDQTIKSFFLHKIQGTSISPQKYDPRWVVEF